MSDDIRHLAHSLLAKSGHRAHVPTQAAPVENQELQKRALPKHILDHAHQYIGHLLSAKKGLRNE